jgi:hypothetical protein
MNPNGAEWSGAGDFSKIFTLFVVDCTFLKERQTTFLTPMGWNGAQRVIFLKYLHYLRWIVLLLRRAKALIYEPQQSGAGNVSKILLYSWWGLILSRSANLLYF